MQHLQPSQPSQSWIASTSILTSPSHPKTRTFLVPTSNFVMNSNRTLLAFSNYQFLEWRRQAWQPLLTSPLKSGTRTTNTRRIRTSETIRRDEVIPVQNHDDFDMYTLKTCGENNQMTKYKGMILRRKRAQEVFSSKAKKEEQEEWFSKYPVCTLR
jgi:hypothetical protein